MNLKQTCIALLITVIIFSGYASYHKMKLKQILIALLIIVIIFSGYASYLIWQSHKAFEELFPPTTMGKEITIVVDETHIIDAEYLRGCLAKDYEYEKKYQPWFNNLSDKTLKAMIKYMKKNDYVIVPGSYTLGQGWEFEDGYCINIDARIEVFKFEKK